MSHQELTAKELLPCPWCGEVDEDMKPILGQRGSRRAVICQHCGVEGGAASTDEFAISNWNNRPPSKQLTLTQQVLDKAVEALKLISNSVYYNDDTPQTLEAIIDVNKKLAKAALASIKE